ncbi:hypothetical protein C4K03_4344 [Pseudomonas synxantha]|uniref:RING-type E3 ubiquitin transferase n=1 Tax=Pseudomonas synxantha TaxID=47883 RepID=A0A3G7UD86_9PSED|nr:NEL-type E3 ubiquitin ligase domain-containing protein [Pseudomonas synxantha]AZE56482.1 hypothetical protein C4K03_4344 [Pseudomonas synxantha]
MTEKNDLSEFTDVVSEDELLAVLLESTGDLDKARVLYKTLPPWWVRASPQRLAALKQAHENSELPRRSLKALLDSVRPLDEFCIERLYTFLLSKGVEEIDVERDQLELRRRTLSGVGADLGGDLIETFTWGKQSLVQAAMQNFDAGRARGGAQLAASVVRSAATGQPVPGLTAEQFVQYCRELDLGLAYQEHLRDVFALSFPPDLTNDHGVRINRPAVQIGFAKRYDMQVSLHIACANQHLSDSAGERLLKLIEADRPATERVTLAPEEKPLIWQGLKIDGACLWSVLVVCDEGADKLEGGSLLIYMPNEPNRPWYEYTSLEDFSQYLTARLQEPAYRTFFEVYLDAYDRLDFFRRFDEDKQLGPMEPTLVTTGFTGFFFNACTGKLQRDAQALAVPTAQADAEADEQRWTFYQELGMDMLNAAAFVVPVVGQLMLGVAIGELLGEVFDGVEDWLHDDNTEALKHLIHVGENVAAMLAFEGGKRVIAGFKAGATSAGFFDQVEAVTRSDQRPALWMPRLAPYRQHFGNDALWAANGRNVLQAQGKSWIKIDDAVYSIGFDAALGQWRINHPLRANAYRPPLIHNGRGGWQHVFEHPEQWQDLRYILTRLDPGLEQMSHEDTAAIAAITGMTTSQARSLAMENELLPQRFQDCVVRFKQHHKLNGLVRQLERGESPAADTARVQLLALPMMSGWPEGRFFEVLNDAGDVLASYPDVAPFDYEDLSIHMPGRELRAGRVMQTLLEALNDEERTTLLGEAVARDKAKPVLERRLLATLKQHYQPLTQKLFLDQEGATDNRLQALKGLEPGLSNRAGWQLLIETPAARRSQLRNTGRVPLPVAEQARKALRLMEQDRALTGLYLPEQTMASTRRIAMGVLQHLPGWPQDLRLQLRQHSLDGAVLADIGDPQAAMQRVVVETCEGFEAFDAHGRSLAERRQGMFGFYQALLDALPQPYRASQDLISDFSSQRLYSRLRVNSQSLQRRIAAYMRGELARVEDRVVPCIQAAPPAPPSADSRLMRKMRKLYPLLDDTQLATLLERLGEDHLSRAKAVEALQQQLNALHGALKAWRKAPAPPALSAAERWDFRLSRKQVARAIEHGWQYMSKLKDYLKRDVPGLSLDGMLHEPLPTLPGSVEFPHLRALSLENLELDDRVAYFLKHFKQLKSLDLSYNKITRMPEVLSLMPQLEYLRMTDNALKLDDYSRARLAGMRSLQVLTLNNNALVDSPDFSQLRVLTELRLRNCRLKEFPKGVSRLPFLESLDVSDNDISVLPEWLFEAPRRYTQGVNLRGNPLEDTSVRLLKAYRDAHGIGMGYLDDESVRLTEQNAREFWLPDSRESRFSEKERIWLGLRNEPRSDGLFTLLAELAGTADSALVRQDLDDRVWRVLDAIGTDTSLRNDIFERAGELRNCEDVTADVFSDMEVLVHVRHAELHATDGTLTPAELLNLARRLFRLKQLERLARAFHVEHPEADELEVGLAFRIGLTERLNLPGQPKHMRFDDKSKVTAQDLNDAEALVKTAELSPQLMDYLVELRFWKKHLKNAHRALFEALVEPYHQRMEALMQGPALDDKSQFAQSDIILQEQRATERAELERLTLEAMKQIDLNVCSMP